MQNINCFLCQLRRWAIIRCWRNDTIFFNFKKKQSSRAFIPTGFPKTAKNIKNALFYDYTCITDPKPTPRISAGNVFALYLQSIILFVCDKPMASSLSAPFCNFPNS